MKRNHSKKNRRKAILLFFLFWFTFSFLFFAKISSSQAQPADASYFEFVEDVQQRSVNKSSDQDACTWHQWFSAAAPLCFILSILRFVSYLLGAAVTLFGQMVSVDNFNFVVRQAVIYEIWKLVRDFFNIAFMLVLLFSAFATIFQVEKYSYKKILLRLIIMALLVNFSFPIARFIVDIANSMMYTLIHMLFQGDGGMGVFTRISQNAGLARGLSPGTNVTISGLLATLIFTFILAITLLAVGIMLVIRTVALAILIIFSPIAFVGAIIPGSSIAGKWWDNLFRYAFFGPIMIFMIYVSAHLMALQDNYMLTWTQRAIQNSTSPNVVGAIAFFSVPIVLLWMSMGIANSMSIAGAGAVMGNAQKFMKGINARGIKVGRVVLKAPGKAAWWGAKQTGIPGGAKQAWADLKRKGPLGSDAVAKREARIAGLLSTDAVVRDMKSRSKKYDDDGEHSDNLKNRCAAGDAAACDRLVQRGDMNTETWEKFAKTNPNQKVSDSLTKDLKKNRLDILIKHKWQDAAKMNVRVESLMKANTGWTQAQAMTRAKYDVAAEEFGKLNPDKWNDQHWKDILDENKNDVHIVRALENSFHSLSDETQAEIEKKLNANNAFALRDQNII